MSYFRNTNISKQPMPKHAKKVFKGIIFEIYQWKQKLYNNSFTTYEKLKRLDTVNVIAVTSDGRVIILEQKQPRKKFFIGNPGGMLEKGESPKQAAKRELIEETGYKAKELILLNKSEPSSKIEWVKYLYLARGCKKVSEPRPDPGEKIKLRLIGIEEYINYIIKEKITDENLMLFMFKYLINPKNNQKLQKLLLGQ